VRNHKRGKKEMKGLFEYFSGNAEENVLQRLIGRSPTEEEVRAFIEQLEELPEKDLFETKEDFLRFVEENGTIITYTDYLRAAVVALALAHRTALTDFGSSRQRSAGQQWTDLIQGLLGEIAFTKIVEKATNGSLVPVPDASEKKLKEALLSDVSWILFQGNKEKSGIRISIKTTKLKGYWLDVPYNQVEHSDVFVLVKVGTEPESFFSFMAAEGLLEKLIDRYESGEASKRAVFDSEEKAVEKAREFVKELSKRSDLMLAIVSGWKKKDDLKAPFSAKTRTKRTGNIEIESGCGAVEDGSSPGKALKLHSSGDGGPKVDFKKIGRFTKTRHCICSVDRLERNLEDLIELLKPGEPR